MGGKDPGFKLRNHRIRFSCHETNLGKCGTLPKTPGYLTMLLLNFHAVMFLNMLISAPAKPSDHSDHAFTGLPASIDCAPTANFHKIPSPLN